MFNNNETTQDICDSMTSRLQAVADREAATVAKLQDEANDLDFKRAAILVKRAAADGEQANANRVIKKVQAFFSE